MRRRVLPAILIVLAGSACGGGDGPSSPSPPPSNPYIVRISAAGVITPRQIDVPPGTRVLFVNDHSRAHEMTSDPHPDHQDCPAINQVGLLNTGQSRETGNLVAVRTCGFHDHIDDQNQNLRGSIVIR
jgi:plastocyanin